MTNNEGMTTALPVSAGQAKRGGNDIDDQRWSSYKIIVLRGTNNSVHHNTLSHNALEAERADMFYSSGIEVDKVHGATRIYNNDIYHVASMGIIALLHLMAVLNVSLAVFNLLPFPVLDGGHILFLGIEKIRGRTLGQKAEKAITQIGISILITLVVFVTYNDIVRLFGDKIQKIFVK